MYSRLISYPKHKSFFLFGPRGTGKSSWVKSEFPKAIYIDLLEAEVYNDLLANPQRLSHFIPKGFTDWVIIDEVQKIPELLDEVHRLIENQRYKFVLTGSSARKLKRKGVNLLAGRALTLSLFPLTVSETQKDFNLFKALKYGQLPSVYADENPQRFLETYVKTYLQEEIQQEGLTRNLGAFGRFLEAASFSQASTLNIASVSRECFVERKVVHNYFHILEDLLLADFLPVFTKRAKRKMSAHSKFYFFDIGVYRTVRPMGPLDAPEEVEGLAFETLFFQELKAINAYLNLGYGLYYWRTAADTEVDFILYGPHGIKAFEVKRKGKVRIEDLRGLKAFLSDYPMAQSYFIYGGEKRFFIDNIEIIPFTECLLKLPEILSK